MNPKRDILRISAYQSVETGYDWNDRYFIVYSNNASIFTRDIKELRRFLKIAKGLPSREALDSWLASLADMDRERVSKRAQPLTSEAVLKEEGPNLSQELLATGFGPECHDVDNDNTRMIT